MGSKKYTRDVSEVTAVFAGSKECIREGVWLLFVSAGSKKCTRDVSEVVTLFMGSKECIRDCVGCSLCLLVHKNVPEMLLVTLCVRGFKEMCPRWCLVAFRVRGFKKCTRNNVGCFSSLWVQKKCTRNNVGCSLCLQVQKKYTRDVSEVTAVFMGSKNIPATMSVALSVCRFKKMHPRTELNGCV